MSNNNFEEVIKLVSNSKVRIDESVEKLVCINNKTGEFAYEEDFFSGIFRDILGGTDQYSYFILNFINSARLTDLSFEFDELTHGKTINLQANFRFSLQKGAVSRVVKFLSRKGTIEEKFKAIFTQWAVEHLKENQIASASLNNIVPQLKDLFSKKALSLYGLNLAFISITLPMGDDSPPPLQISFVHEGVYEIIGDPLKVKTQAVFSLETPSSFYLMGIINPAPWIKERLEEVLKEELHGKTYKEIIGNFQGDILPQIRYKLGLYATQIGYKVKEVVNIPNIEVDEFLNDFSFSTEVTDRFGEGQKYFTTKDSMIPLELGVLINAKGTSISVLNAKYLKQGNSIVSFLKERVKEQIMLFLRNTTWEEYHTTDSMHFEENLKQAIKKDLINEFAIKIESIIIRCGKSELRKRLEYLKFESIKTSIGTLGNELNYELTFEITGVSDWEHFEKRHDYYKNNTGAEVLAIADLVKGKMNQNFDKIHALDYTIVKTKKFDSDIKNIFDTQAGKEVEQSYGLSVRLISIVRRSSGHESDRVVIFHNTEKTRVWMDNEMYNAYQLEWKEAIDERDFDLANKIQKKLEKLSEKRDKSTKESGFLGWEDDDKKRIE